MHALLVELERLVTSERDVTADVIKHIALVDEQELYREEACSSMFVYCVERLHFSEDAAFTRITVARVARKFPVVLDCLASGRVHLSGLRLLCPHFTAENHQELLQQATHKTKRQVEELCVLLAPKALIPETIRRLPDAAPALPSMAVQNLLVPERVAKPARVEPLRPEQYGVHFTANRELKEKLERARALLLGADLAEVVDKAMTLFLADLEKKRFGKTDKPKQAKPANVAARRVPNAIKRAVCERDQNQCTYEDRGGQRCSERVLLEYDHIRPFTLGGQTTFENLRLLCRTHNLLATEPFF